MRVNRRLYDIIQESYLMKRYNDCTIFDARGFDRFIWKKLADYPKHGQYIKDIRIELPSERKYQHVSVETITKALKNVTSLDEMTLLVTEDQDEYSVLKSCNIKIKSVRIIYGNVITRPEQIQKFILSDELESLTIGGRQGYDLERLLFPP